jgi:hypothetical protein
MDAGGKRAGGKRAVGNAADGRGDADDRVSR